MPDPRDAEDILQDVFYELVEANRLLMPIEHVTGWLFRVARNRITDLFRRKTPQADSHEGVDDGGEEPQRWEDLLPSPDAGPEALYARNLLLDELESAIDELPEEQRAVFVAHELEGRSFKEMAAETGVSVNTLLSRKRYAVRHLRERLTAITTHSRNHEEPHMKRKWILIAPLAIAGFMAFIALGGFAVQLLWNWLLPPLVGWQQVTFWQAIGLLALCRILFGGLGRHGFDRSSYRRRMTQRWEHMTPEERERFRHGMRGRWGCVPPGVESKPE